MSRIKNSKNHEKKEGITQRVPKLARWILKRTISEDIQYSAIGDFDEIFHDFAKDETLKRAKLWYWQQALKSLPSFFLDASFWRFVMLKNYFKSTLRNMKRDKLVTILNITGLTIGFISTVLILLFIKDELSYDKHYTKHKNIYRISTVFHFGKQEDRYAFTPMRFGPALKELFPEIQEFARFRRIESVHVQNKNMDSYETGIYYGDPSAFKVFDFPFIHGGPENTLKDPNSIVLTNSLAKKYFKDIDPVGESVRLNNINFRIDGVIEDIKENSHLKFDALVPVEAYGIIEGESIYNRAKGLWIVSMYTYFLMHEGTTIQSVLDKFPQFFDKNMKIQGRDDVWFDIEALPLAGIHFQSRLPYDLPVGNILNIYIFAAIAAFILIIAVINYLNIATALSARREKEVGMRKVVGANKNQLIAQFLSEAIIISGVAWLFSLIFLNFIMPYFNKLSDKNLKFSLQSTPDIFLASIVIAVLIGFLAGVYPAFLLSSFHPVNALKRIQMYGRRGGWLRKALVVFQFSLAGCVIIATAVVSKQLHYIQNTDLGYSKENVIVVPMRNMTYMGTMSTLKTELERNPNVLSVSAASEIVGDKLKRNAFFIDKNDEITQVSLLWFSVDYDFLDSMNIKVIQGRNFSPEFSTDEDSAFLVNETAIRELGWADKALGRRRRTGFDENKNPVFSQVIGVVEDFNYGPLHNVIEPVLIFLDTNTPNFLYIKINARNVSSTISHIKDVMLILGMPLPPNYFFLDETLYKQYKSEELLRKLVSIFTMLCIFISCLGLLGLSYFLVTKKTKEIGIRKVLGASEPNIVILLSQEFMKSVLLANAIAWPAAFFVMNRWLQNFAYRTSFGWQPFILSGILSFSIALLTVSALTIKAARSNPVANLRDE